MNIDGALGYSIDSIFGRGKDMWTESVKDIIELEPGLNFNKGRKSLDNQIFLADNKHSDIQNQNKEKGRDGNIR